MSRAIKFSTNYNHPIAKVWKAFSSKEAMSDWLMPCDFEPKVGHEFQFQTKSYPGYDGIIHCKVLEVKDQELLSFTWNSGGLKDTRVTFQFEADGDKTILHFEHSGFEGLFNKLIIHKMLSNGWKKDILVIRLPKYLANE